MSVSMSIGELGRATGTNVETVRYYERIGLLPKPPRSGGNYRIYGAAARDRLGFIRRARELGFSIEEIRALLGLADRPDRPCAEVDALATRHLAEVEARIADLERLRDTLRHLAGQCRTGRVADCRILEALSR